MHDLRNNLPMLYDFYIVAKAGSVSKAADENFVSQPNLSRSIKNLEGTLGLELIISNNKGIKLTSDGIELYKKLDDMFSNISKYNMDDVNLTGTLAIGTTRNIADNRLSKYLLMFNKTYPNVKIKIFTDSASNLNTFLAQHKIDVLIDYLPNINFSESLNLEIKAIEEFNTCFACSEDFYERCGKNIRKLSELNDYNLLIPGSSRRKQMLDRVLQSNNIELNPIMEMPDSKLMADLVNGNDYIGYFVEDEAEHYNLQKLNLDISLPTNSIGLIYRKNTMNKITKNFVEMVLDNC